MALQAKKNDATDPTEELERELEVASEVCSICGIKPQLLSRITVSGAHVVNTTNAPSRNSFRFPHQDDQFVKRSIFAELRNAYLNLAAAYICTCVQMIVLLFWVNYYDCIVGFGGCDEGAGDHGRLDQRARSAGAALQGCQGRSQEGSPGMLMFDVR